MARYLIDARKAYGKIPDLKERIHEVLEKHAALNIRVYKPLGTETFALPFDPLEQTEQWTNFLNDLGNIYPGIVAYSYTGSPKNNRE